MKQAKQALIKYAARKALKAGLKLGLKAAATVAAAIGWPLAVVLIVILLVVVVFGGVYSAMPGSGLLTGATASELDAQYREYAEKTVREWNVKETWQVPGEGSWYPGQGSVRFSRFADRFGRDAALANTWADIYAPALMTSARDEKEDRMKDTAWVETRMKEAAEKIRPFFYYKESKVIISSKDGSSTETVYLLVEAYTVRGHRQYEYEWVTERQGDASVTYERLKREIVLSDGKEYLQKFLEGFFQGMENDTDKKLTTAMTWEAMQAFSARQEWLAWLLADAGNFYASLSAAAIPPEYFSFLKEAEEKTGVPVWFLAGVITIESNWNPLAVNEKTGCFGLTQLAPAAWQEYAPRCGFDVEKDRSNPRAQVLAGAYLLRNYLGGDVDWAGAWQEQVKAGLARYGGYGSDMNAASGYISRVVNAAMAFSAGGGTWPVPGYTYISSYFGMRFHPIFHTWKIHNGIDIPAPEGTAVVSVSGGVVTKVAENDVLGLYIEIQDFSHVYQYCHLSRAAVAAGQTVVPGTAIGAVGNTGASTGSHLHFGVKQIGSGEEEGWIDPLLVLRG